jgi:hypothetical protein
MRLPYVDLSVAVHVCNDSSYLIVGSILFISGAMPASVCSRLLRLLALLQLPTKDSSLYCFATVLWNWMSPW